MEKQPDEPEDFTNEPLPSMSELMEVQDAVASTLATPFAQPIIAAPKSKAQKQREYRQRIAATRTPAQAAAARKSKNERQRNNRLRQATNMAIASGSLEATNTSSSCSAAPKTRAQIQREYRQRIAASKTPAQAAAAREARNVRDRNYRLCQAANLAIASGSLEATTTSSAGSRQRLNTVHIDTQRQFTDQQRQSLATEPAETTVQPSTSSDQIEVQAQSTWNTKWASSIMRFKSTFLDNDLGYANSVCDRLWFRNDLNPITAAQLKKSIELDDQTQRVKKLDVNSVQSIDDGEAFFTDIKEETTPVQEFMDSLEDSTMEIERLAPSISKSDKNAMKSSKKRKLSSQYAGTNAKPGTCPYCSKDISVSSSSRSQTANNGEQNFNTESGLDANVVFRVYDFLQREYECLQASNTVGFDLSPLANILKRTADATGYNEQTITTILSTRHKKDLHDVSIKIEHNYIDQSNREEHSINNVDVGDHGMDEETQDELVLKCEVSEEVINKPSCSNKSVTDAKQIHIKVEPEDTYPNKWADAANESITTQVHDNEANEDSYPTKWSGCSYKSVKGPQIQIKLEPDEDQCSVTGSSLNAAESDSSILELTPVIETDRSTSENALYLEVSPLLLSTSSSLNPVEIDVPVTQVKIEPQNDLSESTTKSVTNTTQVHGNESNKDSFAWPSCSNKSVADSQILMELEPVEDPFSTMPSSPSLNVAKSDSSIPKLTSVIKTDRSKSETALFLEVSPLTLRTANYNMADELDDLMDLTDLPIPSRSDVLTEAQDAAASTSATPFANPPTIAPRKTKAEKQREYRQRIAASRTPAQVEAARKWDAERQRKSRLRKTATSTPVNGSLESNTASFSRSGSSDVQTGTQRPLTHQHQTLTAENIVQPGTSSDQIEAQQSTWKTKWASAIMRFELTFLDNEFGYACSVCDRLWFKNELKPITEAQLQVISAWYIKESRVLCREDYKMVCNICKRTLNKKSMPPLAKVNGFTYPEQPPDLQPLDPISERLISPRLPFMQVRRLRYDFSHGIIGQVINVPVDVPLNVQEMVKCLPRKLNNDDVINVNIERNVAHKSVYISGYMSKNTISAWLTVLQKSPLYRLYEINVDLSRLDLIVPFVDDIQDNPSNRIENITAENTPESEILASRQHTMMWNEEDCLNIAKGHKSTPLDVIYDRHAEELSFPSIYFGEPRRFNSGVLVSPFMIASSEIRRRDRRGATPQKILYVAMKMLRLRMVDGIHSTFRNFSVTENVTRSMLEDTEFLKEHVIQNLAFMKTVPNSVQYWASRKRDLFALIRQLGKPTAFLTISANEIHWMKLLTILLKLSKKYPGKTAKDLNISERCTLVNDDPVSCCIYFYKLIDSLMKMLKSKQSYNPFGKYSVKDYFLRIEFQDQGSPRAHILMWLNDDPREAVSENMPKTIHLVEKLSSVARDDVPNNSIYANHIHKHNFNCTKRGETNCRFGIPYWPMTTTRVLIPIPQFDKRLQTLQQKANELRTSLGERQYTSMDEFLTANGLTDVSYLDIVRSTLRRPTLVFKRNFDELMTNTFNPYLAGEVNSKIDIQFILDDYSCADYIVEYINKSARRMGNLRRELITMMQKHPYQDYAGQLKELSSKLLNGVEMTAQEAAWYLLRQPMSETSRHIVYIPTVWPIERQRCRKRRIQMDREGIDGDSTDIWTKNIIQRYEERPESLEQVYLAEFAAWYANANDFVGEEDDVNVDDDENSEAVPEARTSKAPKEYRRRQLERIIRYRRYDTDETVDYKREMVLLYVSFRNEISDIINQNKFLQLFKNNKDTIMERRSLFETNLIIENVTEELEETMILQNDDNSNLQEEESKAAFLQRFLDEDGGENVGDHI